MPHARWLVATNLGIALGLAAFAAAHLGAGERWSIAYAAAYAASAVTTLAALHVRRGWIAAGVVGVVAAVWGGLLWTDVLGHALVPARWRHLSPAAARHQLHEALGLSVACTWLSISSLLGWRAAASVAER